MNPTLRRALGLAAGAVILGAAVVLFKPTSDVGYVEIKTVPIAPVTQTALYINSTKLAPIKQGNAILQDGSARCDFRPTVSPERWRRCAISW